MSHNQTEKSVMGMTNRSHKHISLMTWSTVGPAGNAEGEFPDFLKVCDQKGKDHLPHIFEEEDKKEDEKIRFSKFWPSVEDIARDHCNQSHGEVPCSGEHRGPSPARGLQRPQ